MNAELRVDKISFKNKNEVEEVKNFLASFQLKFDEGVDYTVVARSEGRMVATSSKEKNIVKCFAIDENYQGLGLSTQILTPLINKMFDEGYYHSMVFTKADNKNLFSGMGYKEVASTDKVILMEMGNTSISKEIEKIIKKHQIDVSQKRAMLLMNCNPFTLGHRFLVERVASENKEVLLFVVEEDRSVFPFDVRFDLVRAGVEDLTNVKVIRGTKYMISSATFPNYFLQKEDDFLLEYTKLDASICGSWFAKYLNIDKRYLGEEPFSKVTEIYNQTLSKILPKYGVEVIIIPRKKIDDEIISASYVRELLRCGRYEEIKKFVPKSTYEFLLSPKGKEIEERLKNSSTK